MVSHADFWKGQKDSKQAHGSRVVQFRPNQQMLVPRDTHHSLCSGNRHECSDQLKHFLYLGGKHHQWCCSVFISTGTAAKRRASPSVFNLLYSSLRVQPCSSPPQHGKQQPCSATCFSNHGNSHHIYPNVCVSDCCFPYRKDCIKQPKSSNGAMM